MTPGNYYHTKRALAMRLWLRAWRMTRGRTLMGNKPHHTFLRTFCTLYHADNVTEWWTPKGSESSEFYDMRDKIPFENMLSGFKPGGLIVYLDRPKTVDRSPDMLTMLQELSAWLVCPDCSPETVQHIKARIDSLVEEVTGNDPSN